MKRLMQQIRRMSILRRRLGASRVKGCPVIIVMKT